jgi:F-type H+-transporting ATPase subunit epsilon
LALQLQIVSPEGLAYQGEVESVVLPGSEGDFGVLPGHERFLTSLRIGEVVIRTRSETLWAAVSQGYAEVRPNVVTVLVDTCELSNEIDIERAELARQRAERTLQDLRRTPDGAAELAEYELARARAVARLAAAKHR